MSRKAKITFVGPLARPVRGKGASFLLVQGKGESVRLEYPSVNTALAARKLLLAGPLAHRITTETLLTAIQTALAQAAEGNDVEEAQGEAEATDGAAE